MSGFITLKSRAQALFLRYTPRQLLLFAGLAAALLLAPILVLAAMPPPDLKAPVAGEIRVRVKRGPSAARQELTLFVDRITTTNRWDERYLLPRLVQVNQTFDTGVAVQPGDELDLELKVDGSTRIRYTTARTRRAPDPQPRVIAPNGRRCGSSGGGEPPLDLGDLMTSSAFLIACSCWEDATDFDFNDFGLCVDYTPNTVPTVTVSPTLTATLTPTLTATMTPPSTDTPEASATSTATWTASPSATSPPTATATPSPRPRPVFLPILLHERCEESRRYVDAVLVLDLSLSMRDPGADGAAKVAAALAAARRFLGLLDLEPGAASRRDRAAIVGFNERAWSARELTADRGQLDLALDGLPTALAAGTRLDRGLDEARDLLGRGGPPPVDVSPLVVFLTDGFPSGVPTPEGGGSQEDTVLAAARRLKLGGARVFTVGLGRDAELPRQLLEQIASRPEDAFQAADAASLARAYEAIAARRWVCR